MHKTYNFCASLLAVHVLDLPEAEAEKVADITATLRAMEGSSLLDTSKRLLAAPVTVSSGDFTPFEDPTVRVDVLVAPRIFNTAEIMTRDRRDMLAKLVNEGGTMVAWATEDMTWLNDAFGLQLRSKEGWSRRPITYQAQYGVGTVFASHPQHIVKTQWGLTVSICIATSSLPADARPVYAQTSNREYAYVVAIPRGRGVLVLLGNKVARSEEWDIIVQQAVSCRSVPAWRESNRGT